MPTSDPPCATERLPVGQRDLSVSRLGLGTAALGGMFRHVSSDDAHAVVRHALTRGLTYVDTAPQYGHGTAERRVGEVLSDIPRASFVLSTKVGRLVEESAEGDTGIFADAPPSRTVFDFSRDGIHRSLEHSLDRLGLDHVDIVYLHDPDDHERQALTEAYPALEELRAGGAVRAIGLGMNQSLIPTRFVQETDIDVVLLASRYTLLDQSGAEDLLPEAAARGVSVVVGGVYNSGILADPRPGTTYDYAQAPHALVARAQRIAETCAQHGVPVTAAAIQFPCHHPAVTSVLTGSRSSAELDRNLAAFAHPAPDQLWDDLVDQDLLPARHRPTTSVP